MKTTFSAWCAGLIVAVVLVCPVTGEQDQRRAKPPEWTQEVLDVFFADARKELVGTRPRSISRRPQAETPQTREPTSQSETGGFAWSRLIDSVTLTTEVKRIHQGLAEPLKNTSRFKSGGNLLCRRDFTLLGTLFGVIAEYDQDVRWKRSASWMRAKCLKAAQNCQAASDQSYASAQQVRLLLEDIIRGQSPRETVSQEQLPPADRAQLMQRMETGLEEQISPALANTRAFRKDSERIVHEGQLLAMFAKSIHQEPYEYSDDDTFVEYADQLQQAAGDLVRATRANDYQSATTAAGVAGQSCSECHEGYR